MRPRTRVHLSEPGPFRHALAAAAVLSCLVAPACTQEPAASPGGGSAPGGIAVDLASLQRGNALLERQIELAAGKDFYLLLDPAGPDLTLMLRGAILQRFPVLGLQVGVPRVAWRTDRAATTWQGVIWSSGELDPPRALDRIVIAPEEGTEGDKEPEPPPIPPPAEELYPVPTRFHVRFANGLSMEIRPREADAAAGRLARLGVWWRAKWGDIAAALGVSSRDAVRLRVVLGPEDAGSLYRSLPPSVRLLVLSGEEPPARPPAPAPASSR